MSVLDDTGRIARKDPGGMLGHLAGFAGQLREALEIGRSVPLTVSGEGITSVVVLGMGGSAIGGELLSGYLADELRVAFGVIRNYRLPGYVGPRTLVIASSYSGNTEETLAAYREATDRRARVVAITTGGELAERARTNHHDVVAIPAGLPPRAALGYSLVPTLIVLGRLGLVRDRTGEIEDAVAIAERAAGEFGPEVPVGSNLAKDLALWFQDRVPVVYGTVPWTSIVAARWSGQLSENSKTIAHRNELPEMNHNEIVGWSEGVPLGGDPRVVFLRDADDHPRVARRIEITRGEIATSGAEVRYVASFGSSTLARLFSLVLLGDYVSCYSAIASDVDPTPVAPIDRLKRALSDS